MGIGKIASSAGVWTWKEFGDGFKAWTGTLIKQKFEDAKERSEQLQAFERLWADFQWEQALQRYQNRMRKLYGHIRILGTTEPVDLDDIFTDVHILEKPLAFRRFDITELKNLQEEPDKLEEVSRIPGLRIVVQERGHRLFILGKPGAGKTTFLKYLVHQFMVAGLNKIPIFITIKDWADSGQSMLDFILHQFDICHFPQAEKVIIYILESGRAVLLFDGLDEVRQENQQRERTIRAVRDMCHKYSDTQAIVTCRVAATDYSFEQFTYIEMADFDDGQVKTYAYKWFRQNTKKSEQFLLELAKPENIGIRDLGRSPLLLSLICLAFDETMHIPQRRVELYEESLDALLKKWDASRSIRRDEIYKKLSLGRKKQMFTRLAAESFEKGEIFFIQRQLAEKVESYIKNLPPADAADDPDGEAVIQAITAQHGIFVERAHGIYAFAHLTFQEYYTARYIVDNTQDVTMQSMMNHLTDHRWKEVFLLTASLLNEADKFFDAMLLRIGELIREDNDLLKIAHHVNHKPNHFDVFHPGALRAVYLFYNFILARNSSLDSSISNVSNLDRALDRVFALAPERAINRSIVIERALDLARVLDHNIDRAIILKQADSLASELALALDRAHALDLAHSHARDFTVEYNLARDLDFSGDIHLTLVNSLSTVLARSLNLAHDRLKTQRQILDDLPHRVCQGVEKVFMDENATNLLLIVDTFALLIDWDHIDNYQPVLRAYCTSLCETPHAIHPILSAHLENLPNISDTRDKWESFYRELQALSIEHQELGFKWELDSRQYYLMANYLQANLLLLECLDVAYVTNRDFILEKVLRVG